MGIFAFFFSPPSEAAPKHAHLSSDLKTDRLNRGEENIFFLGLGAQRSNGDIHGFLSLDITSVLKVLGHEKAGEFLHRARSCLS